MPTADELRKRRDQLFYESRRAFAERKRRAENGRKPRPKPTPELPPPPTEDEWQHWLEHGMSSTGQDTSANG